MALKDKAKGAVSWVTRIATGIKKIISFIATPIGQVVLYLVAGLLIGLLIYIVLAVIAKDIGKLVGLEAAAAQSDKQDYVFLTDLTNSGYDGMLNAEELVDFYAFEYAVLMDAARFMEETGTLELEPRNTAEVKHDDPNMSEADLAYMRTMSLRPPGESDEDLVKYIQENYDPNYKPPHERQAEEEKKKAEEERKYWEWYKKLTPEEKAEEDKKRAKEEEKKRLEGFKKDATKEDLFYYPVYNEYTAEYSLIPYLELEAQWDKLTFYIEAQGEDGKSKYNPGDKVPPELYATHSRWDGVYNVKDGVSQAEAFEFFMSCHSVKIVRELNSRNWSLFTRQDATWGTGPEVIDLYKTYNESTYYENIQTPTQYKIPLRVLLDRFLPNATLMSSWRMLAEDGENGTVGDDVVAEIKEIYSKACLSGEKVPSGEKLLLKDAFLVNTVIDETTDAMDLFDKTVIPQVAKFEYLHSGDSNSGETMLLYGSYQPEFDSRTLVSGDKEEGSSEDEEQDGDGEGEDKDGAPAPQDFPGTFADDVMDDIEIILKHFADDNSVEIKKESYDRILTDALNIMKPVPETPNTTRQYIVYMPLLAGGYQTKCTAVQAGDEAGIREHYGLGATQDALSIYEDRNPKKRIVAEHKDKNNVYKSSYIDCFVPFLKIAYSLDKDGYRTTVAIICYNGAYSAYMVKGKEIDDYAKISNKATFAIFETFYAKASTFGHWENQSETGLFEGWAVTDAFEGMSLGRSITGKIFYTNENGSRVFKSISMLSDIAIENIFMESLADVLKEMKVEGAILPAEAMAIIRQNKDPMSRDYSKEMLTPVNDATPKDSTIGNSTKLEGMVKDTSGRENDKSTQMFINLKALGLKEDESTKNFLDAVTGKMNQKLNAKEGVIFSDPDELIRAVLELPAGTEITEEQRMQVVAPSFDLSGTVTDTGYAVVMPVKQIVAPFKQTVIDRGIRFYMVKEATLWSSEKTFINDLVVQGIYKNKDRENENFLVPNNSNASGLKEYNCSKEANWRCKLFAPIFAGEDDESTTARESDVLLLLSEWEEASNQNIYAADHFIRDLHALINYSKGIEFENTEGNYAETDSDGVDWEEEQRKPKPPQTPVDETEQEGETTEEEETESSGKSYVIEPIYKADGETPYIHPGSYEYLYIPAEILEFDDTTCEKAFWLERLITVPEDPLDPIEDNHLRSQSPTHTWQIVDYELYEECQNKDSEGNPTGTSKVYALWPFGSQFSRSLYVFASNASDEENDRIMKTDAKPGEFQGWGGYFACHQAADWYGRSQSRKIYREIFGITDNAAIKSAYSNGKVTLLNTDSTEGDDMDLANSANGLEVSLNQTAGGGLYEDNTPVTLILGGNRYTFNGTAAAVYGYELYRQTLITKSPTEAEKIIREQLKEELDWTEIRAVAPGIVTRVTGDSTSGFAVTIRHAEASCSEDGEGPNVTTSYCHMKRFPLVQKGQYVGAGTLLGYEGTTGKSKGYHLHTSYNVNGVADNPTYYNYPFFTPFFYAEKAEEVDYALDSEYMSIERTIFPYGQISGVINPTEYNTIPTNEDGTLKVQNYVPYKPLLEDTKFLLNENSGFAGYKDYSKLQTYGMKNTLGGVNYAGDIIKTNPQYFDKGFIAGVSKNNNKITGAKPAKPIMLSEDVEGGFTRRGWQYVWTYNAWDDKPIIKQTVTPSEEEYQAFEAELVRQVNIAGRGTRGAAVTAARFLAGFPYVIPYLGAKSFETNVGMYGHHGLNRTWGVRLGGTINGFDCGAFVNWTMVNAGIIDDGSREYGGNNANSDLYGEDRRTYLLSETRGMEVKPGDFYHTLNENYDPTVSGGAVIGPDGKKIKTGRFTHIGIIIAVDENYIYVAEELSYMGIGRYPRYSDKHFVTFCDNIYNGEGNYDKELYTENEIPLPLYFKEDYGTDK